MQQASIYLPSSPFLSVKSFSKTLLFPSNMKHHQSIQISSTVKAAAASEAPEVDYSSMASSVFPAEACETVGGVACDVDMFPETKLREEPKPKPKTKTKESTSVDREYLEYNSPKTVFISEACDDLGGEFCDPDYQSGVIQINT